MVGSDFRLCDPECGSFNVHCSWMVQEDGSGGCQLGIRSLTVDCSALMATVGRSEVSLLWFESGMFGCCESPLWCFKIMRQKLRDRHCFKRESAALVNQCFGELLKGVLHYRLHLLSYSRINSWCIKTCRFLALPALWMLMSMCHVASLSTKLWTLISGLSSSL